MQCSRAREKEQMKNTTWRFHGEFYSYCITHEKHCCYIVVQQLVGCDYVLCVMTARKTPTSMLERFFPTQNIKLATISVF